MAAFTGHLDEHTAALRALASQPSAVRLEGARHTAAEAAAVLEQVDAALRDEANPGQVRSWGPDGGVVAVGLRADARALADDLLARFGHRVEVTPGRFHYPSGEPGPDTCRAAPAGQVVPGLTADLVLDGPGGVGRRLHRPRGAAQRGADDDRVRPRRRRAGDRPRRRRPGDRRLRRRHRRRRARPVDRARRRHDRTSSGARRAATRRAGTPSRRAATRWPRRSASAPSGAGPSTRRGARSSPGRRTSTSPPRRRTPGAGPAGPSGRRARTAPCHDGGDRRRRTDRGAHGRRRGAGVAGRHRRRVEQPAREAERDVGRLQPPAVGVLLRHPRDGRACAPSSGAATASRSRRAATSRELGGAPKADRISNTSSAVTAGRRSSHVPGADRRGAQGLGDRRHVRARAAVRPAHRQRGGADVAARVAHGVVPDSGGVARLFQIAGHGLAADMALTGRVMDADEALATASCRGWSPTTSSTRPPSRWPTDREAAGLRREALPPRPPAHRDHLVKPSIEEEALLQAQIYASDDYAEFKAKSGLAPSVS